MARYAGDPRWIRTRFRGECAKCKRTIAKGDRAFYAPVGRTLQCSECGEQASAQFAAEAWDEDNYAG